MNCGKKVFDWVDGKAVVTRSYDCVVGCSTCAALCQARAISFPEIGPVRAIYAKEKIWDKVKEKLQEEGKIPS
jgi:coenzyme F420-reducing hydrogenase gamma subunit